MSVLDLFRKRTQDVFYTRVLVCSVGQVPEDELDRDFNAYQKYLGSVTLQRFADANELVNAFRDRYDIVHVLTAITVDGKIDDSEINGTELIQKAALDNTKLLWIASSNDPKGYIKGFKANGNKLNLVMTIDRRGDCLPNFIGKLLHEMQSGSSMPVAWNRIAPQIPGQEHPDAPASIFYSGLGQVRFV